MRRLYRVTCLHVGACDLSGEVMMKTRLRALSYNTPDASSAHRIETSGDGGLSWTYVAIIALSVEPAHRTRRDPNAPIPGQMSMFGDDVA